MFSRFLMLGVNHRLVSFLFLVLVTYVSYLGLSDLRVDTGFNSMISDTNPDKPVYDQIAREFGSDNRTIVYVRDTKLWSPGKLAALEELHYALEGLDFVERAMLLVSVIGRGEDDLHYCNCGSEMENLPLGPICHNCGNIFIMAG